MTQPGDLSPDGMWRWDGQTWQPSERQMAASAPPTGLQPVGDAEGAGALLGPDRVDKRAAKAAARAQAAAAKEEQRRASTANREAAAFAASPVGRARTAFSRGDQVFQYSIDVLSQQAVIVAMVGSTTTKSVTDPSDVLNAVSREGWELVNGSFVFVEEGQQSRDKFMSSGQNVAIKGTTYGYYLFRRNESLHVPA